MPLVPRADWMSKSTTPNRGRAPQGSRVARAVRGAATGLIPLALSLAVSGCSVNADDLLRWEDTQNGPTRLTAVMVHDKYPLDLRVQAAMSLIRMQPRKGKHVGIERLVKAALVCDEEFAKDADEPCLKRSMPPDERAQILDRLVPLIVEELKKPPPPPAQKGQVAPDPSFNFKDAAYLMLTYEKAKLINDPALRETLEAALVDWAMADFDRRLSDRNQAFGMEQLLALIGPPAVKGLPTLMTRDSSNLAKMSDLVARIGSKETKEAAGKKLVEIAKYIASDKWRDDKMPELKEANTRAGFSPSEKQLDKQMADFQNESVVRIYASMKKVGGSAVVEYGLDVAADKKAPEKRRQAALAALEGHIDKGDDKRLEQLFELAKSDAPAVVIDQVFRRIKELPREKVSKELYSFFDGEDWRLRRLAAATLLQMSKAKHIDEFLKEYGTRAKKNFNLAEAITVGTYLGGLEGGEPEKALTPHMKADPVPARVAALAYWYDHGDQDDVSTIAPYGEDKTKIPKCEDDGKCSWQCTVKVGEGDKAKEEAKPVETVGDFVNFCVLPKVKAKKKKDEGKKTDSSDDKKKEDGKKE